MDLSPETMKMVESAGPWVVATTVICTLLIKQYFGFRLKKLDSNSELKKLEIEKEEKDWDGLEDRQEEDEKRLKNIEDLIDEMERSLIRILDRLADK